MQTVGRYENGKATEPIGLHCEVIPPYKRSGHNKSKGYEGRIYWLRASHIEDVTTFSMVRLGTFTPYIHT